MLESIVKKIWVLNALIAVGFLLAVPSPARSADDPWNIEILGRWSNGAVRAIAVRGDIAYFGNGPVLDIVDVSNPALPVELGRINLASVPAGVALGGDYVYVAGGGQLQVVDIADPTDPVEVGHIDLGEHIWDIVLLRDHAYVVFVNGFYVIDVTDPTQPATVGSFEEAFQGSSSWRLDAVGSHVYAVGVHFSQDYFHGLRIFDVSDPSHPTPIGGISSDGEGPMNVVASGNLAYVSDYQGDIGGGLYIYDVSNPSTPVKLGEYTYDDARPVGLGVLGDHVFVSDGGFLRRTFVIDASDPANPVKVNELDFAGEAFATLGNRFFVGTADALRTFDVTTPASPVEAGSFATTEDFGKFDIAGDHVFLADGGIGLRVVDTQNPERAREVARYTWPDIIGVKGNVTIHNEHAFVTGDPGLRVVDISNPLAPVEVAFYTAMNPGHVVISGEHAYITDRQNGLQVIDISNPGNPVSVGSFPEIESTVRTVGGALAYATDPQFGIRLYDASEPAGVFELSSHMVRNTLQVSRGQTWFAFDVDVAGDHAFVASERMGVRVIDVSDPLDPHEVAAYEPDGSVNQLEVSGDRLFAVTAPGASETAENGLHVVDISDPASPQQVGWWPSGGRIEHLRVSGDEVQVSVGGSIYLARFAGGPTGIPNGRGASFEFYQNYPNPFNPNTTITYTVPEGGGRVTLSVHDVAGRLIRTLADGFENAGTRRVIWNGRDGRGNPVASGVYLYRLTGPGFDETRKMTFLK